MQALFGGLFCSEDKVLCQMVDVLGPMPSDWQGRWENWGDFFDSSGKPKADRDIWPRLEDAFEERVQKFRREESMGEFGRDETTAILDMIRQMLRFRPGERLAIDQVLNSEWMVNWARPPYQRAQTMT